MSKPFIYILPLLLAILISSDSKNVDNMSNKLNILTETSLQITDDFYFMNLFSNPKVTLDNHSITITFNENLGILKLEPMKQFMNFDIFTRRFRFILNTISDSDLSKLSIILHLKANNYSYKYISKLTNKDIIYSAKGYLALNEKIIYSSSEFNRLAKETFSPSKIEKVNGYDDLEIHQYAVRFFGVMTKKGTDYNPETDNQLVLDAVYEKFGITPAEYAKIDSKYCLTYTHF